MMEIMPDIGRNPDYGLAEKPKFKTKTVQFGDGFVQRQPDGINNVKRSWTVRWSGISEEQKDLLYNFFMERQGAFSFLWVKPLTDEAVKVVCPEAPSFTYDDYEQYALSVTLEEDFAP